MDDNGYLQHYLKKTHTHNHWAFPHFTAWQLRYHNQHFFPPALKTCRRKHMQSKLSDLTTHRSSIIVIFLFYLATHVRSDRTSWSLSNTLMQKNKSHFRPGHTWGPSSYQWSLKSLSVWKEWLVGRKERGEQTTRQQHIKWMSPGEAQTLHFVILENWSVSYCFSFDSDNPTLLSLTPFICPCSGVTMLCEDEEGETVLPQLFHNDYPLSLLASAGRTVALPWWQGMRERDYAEMSGRLIVIKHLEDNKKTGS